MTLQRLGDRDGWTCWVCGQPVDRAGPPDAPAAPTIDHVLPRARGGTSDPANVRLAHRRCNGARGSHLPELEWPADPPVLDAAPLWPAVQRARRRPGDWEAVAFLADADDAEVARRWLSTTLPLLLGGAWETDAAQVVPGGALHAVRLRAAPSEAAQRGGHRGTRARRRTRRRAR